jgi:hypothetical protein
MKAEVVDQIETLAKFAAETLNGGNFDDKNYYAYETRLAWKNMIRKLIIEIQKEDINMGIDGIGL